MSEERKEERLGTRLMEMAVIGFALAHPQQFYEVQTIRVDQMNHPTCKRVWACIKDVADTDGVTSLEPSILAARLESRGMPADDALAFFTEVMDHAPESPAAARTIREEITTSALKRALTEAGSQVAALGESTKTADEISDEATGLVSEAVRQATTVEVKSLRDELEAEWKVMEQIEAGSYERERGLESGLMNLDNLTHGHRGGELIVIGARPSVGKSSLVRHLAVQFASQQQAPGVIFSMEMRAVEWIQRVLCAEARVDLKDATSRLLGPQDRRKYCDAIRAYAQLPIWIQDTGGMTVPKISALTRQLYFEEGIQWIGIDYLQLIDHVGRRNDSTNDLISRSSKALKMLAMTLDIPVILLSQLNRDCEKRDNKRPRLSDLRSSGSIEQDADVVAFMYRDRMYQSPEDQAATENDPVEECEIIIAKQRNGPVGTAKCEFIRDCGVFRNLTEETEYADMWPGHGHE